jgi:hypothetical protein
VWPSPEFPVQIEQLGASGGDVFVDPSAWRQKAQQYEQDAKAITAGSKARLMVARIIESPMAAVYLSPRQQDHEKTTGKQSESSQPTHRIALSRRVWNKKKP